MTELELRMPARPVRIGIAAAEFNRFITDQLLEGATDAFTRNGLSEDQRVLAWVPGAFELPLAARGLLESGCDAVLALGAVIRGGTPHFDYVAGECARGLSRLALDYGRPVLFGVLTTDDVEQAMSRAAVSEGNKGFDVAVAALQMLGLMERLRPEAREG
ncbi:MAG: 6,7-dimethyl-8-ribityllumazine synthase [Lysobacterales bacterium]